MITVILHVSATTIAQKITLKEKNAPLVTIFDQISAQTGYDFAFTTEAVKDSKPVTINVTNAELATVLTQIFQGQTLDFSLVNKTVTVKPKETTIFDKIKSALSFDKIEVTGRVVGEDGQSLPGATVIVKGTNNSTITDAKGNFTLFKVDAGATLVITFVGYERQEIAAAPDLGKIQMKVASSQLDAVQVIAYGQTTQRLSVGNISSVSGKVIEEQPVNNPLLALEGRVPGLFITQANGLAGGAVTLRIQGQNSIQNGNDALYVIDGVPFSSQNLPNLGGILGNSGATVNGSYVNGSPFSFINPSDIESIEVLKDADATAIYGSRAANGAILITTKKGKAGTTRVNVNAQQGVGQVTRKVDLLNLPEYLQMRHEALKNDGIASPGPKDYDINGLWDTTRSTDWQKLLLGGTAKYTNISSTVSGGSANTQYLIGTTYHRETTVFPGDFADQKGSVHFSINNISPNQKFTVQLSGSYLVDNNQLPQQDLTLTATRLAPDAPALHNPDGTLNWMPNSSGSETWMNPLAYALQTYQVKTNNLIGNAVLSYQILKGLTIRGSLGYTNTQTDETALTPQTYNRPSQSSFNLRYGQYGTGNTNSWIAEPQISYKTTLGKGKLEALAGATVQQNNSKALILLATGFNSDAVLADPYSAPSISVTSSINSVYKYNAAFGRVSYNWDEKYLLNLTARRDGSSRFGSANQFHNFGAIGAGWIFSEEGLFKNNLPFLSFGKLRGSYGTTGNDQIGDYQFLSLYTPITPPVPYQGASGLTPNGLPNPYLQWELTKKLQAGIDLGFLKDRILLTANYVRNRSSNQLLGYNLPIISGFSSITENFPATVENTAWEFSLHTINFKDKNFSWSSSVNFTLPKNKLVAFPSLGTSSYSNSLIVGQPINITKAFHFLGVDPTTGVYQFLDSQGKPTSTPSDPDDRTVIISPFPKFYGGFVNEIQYKSFGLDFSFSFVKQTAQNYNFGAVVPGYKGVNQPTTVLGRWQEPGQVASIQRYNSNLQISNQNQYAMQSDAGISDASYIRLKNAYLFWQLPEGLKRNLHLESGRIFIQGQNLLTLTHYKGMDPENLSVTSLPPLRVLTLGVQVGL